MRLRRHRSACRRRHNHCSRHCRCTLPHHHGGRPLSSRRGRPTPRRPPPGRRWRGLRRRARAAGAAPTAPTATRDWAVTKKLETISIMISMRARTAHCHWHSIYYMSCVRLRARLPRPRSPDPGLPARLRLAGARPACAVARARLGRRSGVALGRVRIHTRKAERKLYSDWTLSPRSFSDLSSSLSLAALAPGPSLPPPGACVPWPPAPQLCILRLSLVSYSQPAAEVVAHAPSRS